MNPNQIPSSEFLRYVLMALLAMVSIFGLGWVRQRRKLNRVKIILQEQFGDTLIFRYRSWQLVGTTRRRTNQLRGALEVGLRLSHSLPTVMGTALRASGMEYRLAAGFNRLATKLSPATPSQETEIGPFRLILSAEPGVADSFNTLSTDLKERLEGVFELGFRQLRVKDQTVSLSVFHDQLASDLPNEGLRQLPQVLRGIGDQLKRSRD